MQSSSFRAEFGFDLRLLKYHQKIRVTSGLITLENVIIFLIYIVKTFQNEEKTDIETKISIVQEQFFKFSLLAKVIFGSVCLLIQLLFGVLNAFFWIRTYEEQHFKMGFHYILCLVLITCNPIFFTVLTELEVSLFLVEYSVKMILVVGLARHKYLQFGSIFVLIGVLTAEMFISIKIEKSEIVILATMMMILALFMIGIVNIELFFRKQKESQPIQRTVNSGESVDERV